MTGADPAAAGSPISLPKGGGAIGGMGETFAADPFTGTGTLTVPLSVPQGRAGMTPALALRYGSGHGNGPFGLGWQLDLPGVTRRTSRGVPRYGAGEEPDVFLLSGAEDLVAVAVAAGRTRYRPRVDSGFARIEHVHGDGHDFWEVRERDGRCTRFGTPRPPAAPAHWRDPAVVADPADPSRVFGWLISEVRDPLGNAIVYEYRRDAGTQPGHNWDQPLLAAFRYADYGDPADPAYLVRVAFDYEERPDPFSDHRSGFEVRTTLRCRAVKVSTHAADGIERALLELRLGYRTAPFNGLSLLESVEPLGIDGADQERLPPLTFAYSEFRPQRQRFAPVTSAGLPAVALDDPGVALVDVRGVGLPDVVELGVTGRVWFNAGGGRLEHPRALSPSPPLSLAEPGVVFADADGNGRADLFAPVVPGGTAGYYPTSGAGWSPRGFRRFRQAPPVAFDAPEVRLVDLDGDGLTDVLRSGTRLSAWFNDPDPRLAWGRFAPGAGDTPPVDLADPRVRLADMTGDGLQDIVLLHNGNVTYWPSLGHNRWGSRVVMRDAPRLPDGFDPRRLLLGDVDGDGAADLVYLGRGRVLVWGNRSGNGWTPAPVVITGTPDVTDVDSVQLCDLHGTGTAGVLFGRTADRAGRTSVRFLDLTGGTKPYLLTDVENHLGARTRITYASSTAEYLRDRVDPATRWRTTLPFPVQVVTRIVVTDAISGVRLTTRYAYHHGYWDGVEREFRGFAAVDRFDSEEFAAPGWAPDGHFAPPTLARTWFHVGPVADADGDWVELDLSDGYWRGDPSLLSRPDDQVAALAALPRAARRDALRALRGNVVRTELYALDGSAAVERPYTVSETVVGVREEPAPAGEPGHRRVFFPFTVAGRTTHWLRGDDPLTQLAFTTGLDRYGLPTGQLAVSVPRGRDPRITDRNAAEPYLATYTATEYARRDDATGYLVDRIARVTTYEVVNDGTAAVAALPSAVVAAAGGGNRDGVSLRLLGHTRNHYDGDAFEGLPVGTLGAHGLPVRVETLVFTDDFLDTVFDPDDPDAITPRPVFLDPAGRSPWPNEYPQEFRAALPPLAGYVYRGEDAVPGSPAGYYVAVARHRYDVHEPERAPRGLRLSSLDPFGAPTRFAYDVHDFLPVRTVDAAGLEVTAEHDLRVLCPHTVTDVNGNRTSVVLSPAGLVTARFVRGSDGTGDAAAPSVRLTHDLFAFVERGEPASVRTTRRVYHDTDPDAPAAHRDDVLVAVEYSDGFGRVVQTRAQAEETRFGDPAFGGGVLPGGDLAPVTETVGRTRAASEPENVVVSGWQVFDNKGRPVYRYEPFFSTGFDFDAPGEAQFGRRVTTFYDALGQAVRTVHPDGSEERVVSGVPFDLADPDRFAPTPWETYTYDANDNAGRTHAEAAAGYRAHWNTPDRVRIDALGRTVESVAGFGPTGADGFVTRSVYDIRGNLLSLTDPAGRVAFRYIYDLAGRRWRTDGVDGGRRDNIPDVFGNPVEGRDARGALHLGTFDALNRPDRIWARDAPGQPTTLRQVVSYGDGGRPDQPAAERAAARAANLLGRWSRHRDEAGMSVVAAADLSGNVLESTRRVIADAPVLATYERAAANGWEVAPFRVDWTPAPGRTAADRDAELLEAAGYTTNTRYDALDRATRQLLPSDVDGHRRELRCGFNRAGALESVTVDGTAHVERIAYDAKGQRVLVAFGNGLMTRYAYDPQTFRPVRTRTERFTAPAPATYRPTGAPVQDIGYVHDLAGNVVAVRERTPGSGIPGNPDALGVTDPVLRALIAGGDALDRRFGYDPIYRLVNATGREHQAPPPGGPWNDQPRGTDPTRAQAYSESYEYDTLGSLTRLAHRSAGGFDRRYTLDGGSNRLNRLTVGGTGYDYAYDPNGNLVAETTTRRFAWNHLDQLATFETRTPGAEPSVHAHYLYDAAGARAKKLVRRQGGAVEVVHYVNGTFEHHRWSGTSPGANNHLHVSDGQERVAILRAGAAHPAGGGPAVAYHLRDHLGSCAVVVDGTGAVTNREEYTPYGETTFGGFTRKRYRFHGMERDEESGLNYHEARYLHPALGRWVSPDPVGLRAHPNMYRFAAANPMRYVDPAGTDERAATATPGLKDQQVRQITDFVQELADEYLEPALRRLPGEKPSPFGTRLHTILQAVVESAPFNAPGVAANRILTEVVIDEKGVIIAFAGKPGGSPKYAVTVDIAILRKGLSSEGPIVGMKAKDALVAGIDYKTGDAKLRKRQIALFRKIDKPLFKLKAGGDLTAEISGSSRPNPYRALSGADESRGPGVRGGAVRSGVMAATAAIGALAVFQYLTTGELPSVGDAVLAAAESRVPVVGLATAQDHNDTVIPLLCLYAFKVCAAVAVGAAVGYVAAKNVEVTQQKLHEMRWSWINGAMRQVGVIAP
ncbi:hypothetical protein Val02_82520 [Virgisporangium aliadipatigenens]|uniref:Uncharacterized protein n=1 Tax=Virgisporangium aliadipatigenens TaxID=741659 RepID=A0A8J3YX51_9ACTN|nr:SpvB/TcaC N-terminal domain-containing protein [Virgisporangium aliadipatigenens]GIJ51366.1 hypothetical protein Val02_82520 [Virgisporangium aliadipatigenens]